MLSVSVLATVVVVLLASLRRSVLFLLLVLVGFVVVVLLLLWFVLLLLVLLRLLLLGRGSASTSTHLGTRSLVGSTSISALLLRFLYESLKIGFFAVVIFIIRIVVGKEIIDIITVFVIFLFAARLWLDWFFLFSLLLSWSLVLLGLLSWCGSSWLSWLGSGSLGSFLSGLLLNGLCWLLRLLGNWFLG